MRWGDLLGLALSALYQQKVRTILSVLGVTIGTFALALSVSIGQGVEAAIIRQFRQNDQLRKVIVWPNYEAQEADVPADALKVAGKMSEARRKRLRQTIVARWHMEHIIKSKNLLTAAQIESLAALPHVRTAIPFLSQYGGAVFEGKTQDLLMAGADPDDKEFRGRIVAGAYFTAQSRASAIVHESLVYSWGIIDEAEIANVLGRTVRLEYRTGRYSRYPVLSLLTGGKVDPEAPEHTVLGRLVERLSPILDALALSDDERAVAKLLLQALAPGDAPVQDPPIRAEFTITGVIRQPTPDDPPQALGADWMTRNADILLPARSAQEFFFRAPVNAKLGARQVMLAVDREENVKTVSKVVEERGFRQSSLVPVIEQFQNNVRMITFAVAFIAAVALMVAALGITNTMIMGVLERTREIGVMKAVGGRDRHIQLLFLVEGASIGIIGGGLGMLLSWLVSFPGEAVARSVMQKQTGTPPAGSLFVFPLAVTLGVPALTSAITTLAALFPSRRAVRVNPVAALRHE
jgi:putative ABC transport system permease protein